MIRIAMLDDQPAVRAGLGAIIASEPDLQLVGSAAREAELWPLLRRTRPDVLVLDLDQRGRDGLAVTLKARRLPDPPAIVLYTGSARGPVVVAGVIAGADAVASSTSSGSVLVEAIRHAAASAAARKALRLLALALAAIGAGVVLLGRRRLPTGMTQAVRTA